MAKSADANDEVAALYQLTPGEFTAARNALAKKLGPAGADVRTLEKPQAAAWAVNQLYWQRRPVYDALTKAAVAMRSAHANMLSGRKADVPQAESAHRDAVRLATQAIRELAQAAGESLSANTLEAISETLRALPSNDQPGQLTRPLKPMGMEALIGIGVQGLRVPGPGSTVQSPGSRVQGSQSRGQSPGSDGARKITAAEKAAAKKEEAENAKRRKELEKALKAAEAAERQAEAALEEARKAVRKVDRDYEAVRDRLQFLEKQRSDVEQEAHKRARELQDAANARTQAAQELRRVT
jgi:DNA repair exonuclease SbcCD ATPase subunit